MTEILIELFLSQPETQGAGDADVIPVLKTSELQDKIKSGIPHGFQILLKPAMYSQWVRFGLPSSRGGGTPACLRLGLPVMPGKRKKPAINGRLLRHDMITEKCNTCSS